MFIREQCSDIMHYWPKEWMRACSQMWRTDPDGAIVYLMGA